MSQCLFECTQYHLSKMFVLFKKVFLNSETVRQETTTTYIEAHT